MYFSECVYIVIHNLIWKKKIYLISFLYDFYHQKFYFVIEWYSEVKNKILESR